MLAICPLLFLLASAVQSSTGDSTAIVKGRVVDSASTSGIPLVIIENLKSKEATATAIDGSFSIRVHTGLNTLRFSHIAYEAALTDIDGSTRTELTIALKPRLIHMAEVVVSGEEPGVAIMRTVIRRIDEFRHRMRSYRFEGLSKTREGIQGHEQLAVSHICVVGHVLHGYRSVERWSKAWSSYDSIFTSGAHLSWKDLTEEKVASWTSLTTGVLSAEALEDYRFVLDSVVTTGGKRLDYIAVAMRNPLRPGFDGEVVIDDSLECVREVVLHPNAAFNMPFLFFRPEGGTIHALFDSTSPRWLPNLLVHSLDIVGTILTANMRIRHETVLLLKDVEYGLDSLEEPSIWDRPRSFSDRPALDTAEINLIPLTDHERDVLVRMDTTGRVESQTEIMRASRARNAASRKDPRVLDFSSIRYSRPTGLLVGLHAALWTDSSDSAIIPSIAMGTADRRIQWGLRCSWQIFDSSSSWLNADVYDRTVPTATDKTQCIGGMVSDFLFGESTSDYVRSFGVSFGLTYAYHGNVISLLVRREEDRNAPNQTSFRVFKPSMVRRPSLQISEGWWNIAEIRCETPWWSGSLSLDDPEPALSNERSFRTTLRYRDTARLADAFLVSPHIAWDLQIASTFGRSAPQRLFSPETRILWYAPSMTFLGMRPREFAGDQLFLCVVECDLRGLPFLALGLTGLYQYGLTISLHGAAANIGHADISVVNDGRFWKATGGWYAETGVSIGGIAQIFSIDCTRRLTNGPDWNVTIGLSVLPFLKLIP